MMVKRPAGMAWLLFLALGRMDPGLTAEPPGPQDAVVPAAETAREERAAGKITEERQGEIEATATSVIDRLHRTLLEAMQRGRELGYQGRYRLLEPVIREIYDFRAISRYVLGSFWKELPAERKERFIAKMAEYGIATYAARFGEYGGERFKVLAEKPFRERFRVVRAVLEVPDDEDVLFLYILRRTGSGWKVIDVRYDGVSDLALKRSQFSEILEKEGFEALVAKLEEKIADYAAKGNS